MVLSLVTLPPEVRLVIYRYLFKGGITIGLTQERRACKIPGERPESLAITLVCKRLFQDPILWGQICSNTTFVLCKKQRQYASLKDDVQFLQQSLGPENFPNIKCILQGTWPGYARCEFLVPGFSMLCGVRQLQQTLQNCSCWDGIWIDGIPTSVPLPPINGRKRCRFPKTIFIDNYMKSIPRKARKVLMEVLQAKRLTLVIKIKVLCRIAGELCTIVSPHTCADCSTKSTCSCLHNTSNAHIGFH